MALADLVLEGLTLILVIALGAVLIGGLTYLSSTVASANEAKLVGMGTYIYIPAAVYVNGTLYVPMYNIGHYAVVVRQLFIRVGNTLISQTLNTTLAPRQYYVYTTTLNQRPTAVTVIASPTAEPGLRLEFSANVTEPGQVALIPMGTNTGGNGLIEVVVNDPYGAGWEVAWSYAGQSQSYTVTGSTTYAWFINPPYLPIQITFNAQITSNPTGYTCQIQPSQVTNTYGPGSEQVFDVNCTKLAEGVYLTLDPVTQYWVSDWEYVVSWTGASSGYIRGYANLFEAWIGRGSASTPVWASGATLVSGGNNSLAVTTWFIPTNGPITISVEFTSLTGFCLGSTCPTAYTVPATPITVYPPANTTIQLVFSGTNLQTQTYSIAVSVNDPYGATWGVSWSGINGEVSGSQTGSGSASWTVVSSKPGTVYFTATVSPSTCTISPASTSATVTSSNPTASVTFTVTCTQPPPPPPSQPQACTVAPPSVSSQPPGAPQPSSSASPTSIPYGKSASVTFTYVATPASNNYVFQYWVIGGTKYTKSTVTLTQTLTCDAPGKTLTGPSGTAYYQYVPPGSMSINPGTIDLTQSSQSYTLSWSSAWSGYTGTLTWGVSGYATIYYNQPPSTQGIQWWASVTGSVGGATITFAQGSGDLAITNWLNPPNQYYYIVCTVSGSGTVPNVSSSGGSVTVAVTITCQLKGRTNI